MSTLAIVLIVLAAILVALVAGGAIAAGRRARALDARLRERIAAADQALAAAHAQDKGWDPAVVEAAARAAFRQRHAELEIEELQLVQVVDRPGTDADEAVYRIVAGGQAQTLTLGRREGTWVAL